jgi:hypothetical protein
MSIITRKAIRDGLKGKGKWIPKDMAFGDRTQANWKRQDRDQNVADPVEITIGLMDMSDNSVILDFLCESQGGVFIKNEEGDVKSRNVQLDMSNMLKEVSDVWSVCAKSLDDDGKIDANEAIAIRKEAREAMQSIESFISNLEAGRY